MKKLALLLDCCRNEKPDHPFWHYAFCGNERVFGVAAEDMECGYDSRGNSVPCILLRMQERLYQTGALKVCMVFCKPPFNFGLCFHCLSQRTSIWFCVFLRWIDLQCIFLDVYLWYISIHLLAFLSLDTWSECADVQTLSPDVFLS